MVMPHSIHTAKKIRACIKVNPGLRAKDVALQVGLKKETVNSYLYSKQPGGLGNEVFQDGNYGWHLKEAAVASASPTASPKVNYPPQVEPPQHDRPIPDPVPVHAQAENLDREEVLMLTLAEAFQGVTKEVTFTGERVFVRIQPGTRPGVKLRMQGKGRYSSDRSRRGDLLLRLETRSDEGFRLDGDDVVCQVMVSSEMAARGGQLQVPTLDGTATVKIPPGVRSGQSLRLTGKGWRNGLGDRGNQLVKVVVLPAQQAANTPEPVKPQPVEPIAPMPAPTPEPLPQYAAETIQEVFRRDDYSTLSDDEQGRLAQMLEEAELERQRSARLSQPKPKARILRSGWFWVVLLLGGTVTFTAVQVVPRLNPPSPAPVQNNR